ncbi:Mitochondrial mRNA pseudouridine synthase like protein [Argiope bruennichi]|uniref:Mitochondrial mRNA pseudouridine synthase like protein n=1 Tax=Argiope bruennichi TaxID=94029 RepID=A0A8T0E620_ARGBR|nr:Mitochondrial mRNA pseudouridine synthase like protein [Argiope bruennichi]
MRIRLLYGIFQDISCIQRRYINGSAIRINETRATFRTKNIHCYRTLFPFDNLTELAEHLVSSIVYNKNGLIAINKPFGIKIHSHDKPGTRSKDGQRFLIPSIPECDLTIEGALRELQERLNVPSLTILKSAERYTSGIVLLSTDEHTSNAVKKSFNKAKFQKVPHFVHWALTLGYPGLNYKKEKVGIKFLELENEEKKQPIIIQDPSKKACLQKRVFPVHVEYRVLSVNKDLQTSLVEIASSSLKYHFVRIYASSQICSILGDIMYCNRMNTVLGVPVKVQIEHSHAFDSPPLPEKMTKALNLPKGATCSVMPTMLHLRSIFLPSFKGEDLTIVANLPHHFQWTAEQLKLLNCIM